MPETSSQCSSPPNRILCLPLEIREKIYSHLLCSSPILVQYLQFEVDSWILSIWNDPDQSAFYDDSDVIPKRKTGILGVSRQISEEALQVLYGRNLFIVTIHGGAHSKLLKFGAANLHRIRYLRLVAEPRGICYPDPMNFDPQIWVPVLTSLSQLCLVLQQPLRAGGYYNAPSLEEDRREWISWLEPILRFLPQNISSTTVVGVDDDNMVETGEVVRRCFRYGYQGVQTVTGDRIFRRGVFSEEFEY